MKDINVYLYMSEDPENKYFSIYSENSKVGLKYSRTMTVNDADEKDAYGYLFGAVGRYIAPFIRMGDNVKFYASQDALIKEFEGSKLSKVGKIEKCDKNLAETTNTGFLDSEMRSLSDFDMARRLAGFGREPLFPFHPFGYLDAALELPMRLLFEEPFAVHRRHLPPNKRLHPAHECSAVPHHPVTPEARPEPPVASEEPKKDSQPVTLKADTKTEPIATPENTDWFDKLSTEEKVKVIKDLASRL